MRILGCAELKDAVDLCYLGSQGKPGFRIGRVPLQVQSPNIAYQLNGLFLGTATDAISPDDIVMLTYGDINHLTNLPAQVYDLFGSDRPVSAVLFDSMTTTVTCAARLYHDGVLVLSYARPLPSLHRPRLTAAAFQLRSGARDAPKVWTLTDCLDPIDIEGSLAFSPFADIPIQEDAATRAEISPQRLEEIATELRRVFTEVINPSLIDPFVFDDDPWIQPGAANKDAMDEFNLVITDLAHAVLGADSEQLRLALTLPATPAGLPFADISIADGYGVTREQRIRFKFVAEWALREFNPNGGRTLKRRHHQPNNRLDGYFRRSRFTADEDRYVVVVENPGGHEAFDAAERLKSIYRRIASDLFKIDRNFGKRTTLSRDDAEMVLADIRREYA